MCKYVISYTMRSGTSAPHVMPIEDEAALEKNLTSLRSSDEITKITVFTATSRYERTLQWKETDPLAPPPAPMIAPLGAVVVDAQRDEGMAPDAADATEPPDSTDA